MAVGRDLATYTGIIATSFDGIVWEKPAAATSNWLWSVAYGNNQFVAVGDEGTIVTSPDGLAWTNRPAVMDIHLLGVGYGDNTFVATGVNATVLQSDPVMSPSPVLGPLVLLPGGGVQLTLSGLAGQAYPIQASATLTDWVTITNVALTNTSVQFTDPSATAVPRRFYRAVVQ